MDYTLILKKIPMLTKNDLNLGTYSCRLSILSSIIRNIFLLSNSIRKENNLDILCINQFENGKKSLLIRFNGKSIRYLSPDERNILFLLQKIFDIIHKKTKAKLYRNQIINFQNEEWAQSTPGIKFKRYNLDQFFQTLRNKDIILLLMDLNYYQSIIQKDIEQINNLTHFSEKITKNPETEIFLVDDSEFIQNLLSSTLNYTINLSFYNESDVNQNYFVWELILILQAIYSELCFND